MLSKLTKRRAPEVHVISSGESGSSDPECEDDNQTESFVILVAPSPVQD